MSQQGESEAVRNRDFMKEYAWLQSNSDEHSKLVQQILKRTQASSSFTTEEQSFNYRVINQRDWSTVKGLLILNVRYHTLKLVNITNESDEMNVNIKAIDTVQRDYRELRKVTLCFAAHNRVAQDLVLLFATIHDMYHCLQIVENIRPKLRSFK